MREITTNIKSIIALFGEEKNLRNAAEELINNEYKILDIITPYPIEGLENICSTKTSYLSICAFIFGILGLVLAIFLQIYVHADYVLTFGTKPLFPIISYVPVAFALTILLAVIGLGISFSVSSNLIPGQKPKIYHDRITIDSFCLIIFRDTREDQAIDILEKNNVREIRKDYFVKQNIPLPIPLNLA